VLKGRQYKEELQENSIPRELATDLATEQKERSVIQDEFFGPWVITAIVPDGHAHHILVRWKLSLNAPDSQDSISRLLLPPLQVSVYNLLEEELHTPD